jgi:uncharacterized protein
MSPHHDPAARRFSLAAEPGGPASVLDYELAPGRVVFTHTGVPASLRGHGLAAVLVQAGLSWARTQGLQVVPACSYVKTYIERHPEWRDLTA